MIEKDSSKESSDVWIEEYFLILHFVDDTVSERTFKRQIGSGGGGGGERMGTLHWLAHCLRI